MVSGKLGKKLGIYMQDEIESDDFSQKYEFNDDEREAFSARVVVGPAYTARKAKASKFRDHFTPCATSDYLSHRGWPDGQFWELSNIRSPISLSHL